MEFGTARMFPAGPIPLFSAAAYTSIIGGENQKLRAKIALYRIALVESARF